MQFRPETPEEILQIYEVIADAFGRTDEADLVDAIRNSENFIPELSMVAKTDERVVGHVLFSAISLETSGPDLWTVGLAPLAVAPPYQLQGIGTRLVQAGLTTCRELGNPIVIVLGHPHFYQRFGFVPASQFGVKAPFEVPDEAFMLLKLNPEPADIRGSVRYPDYFSGV